MSNSGPVAKRYGKLSSDKRKNYELRAEDAAELTLPALFPRDGHTGSSELYRPFQSLGARGVNSLASKIAITLFPPGSPFFKLDPDLEEELNQIKEEDEKEASALETDFDKALSQIEIDAIKELESTGFRVPVLEAIKHLLVVGNVLLFLRPDGSTQVFTLRQYVTRRAPNGKVLEIIIEQKISLSELDDEMIKFADLEKEKSDQTKEHAIYTRIYWDRKGFYRTHQELNGKDIPSARGSFKEDQLPWMALRFTAIDGEDYGRSFVEDYIGDLISYEGLSKALLDGAAAASRLLLLVDPNGSTDEDDITKAENGDVVTGNANDVSVLTLEKFADFRVAFDKANQIEQELSRVFLLNSSIQRNAERVTAEEIRILARELEDTLGGIYSSLSRDLQLPIAVIRIEQFKKQGKLPKIKKNDAKISIITGLDALGRGHDLSKQQQFLQNLAPLGEQAIAKWLNVPNYIKDVGTNLGIDGQRYTRSEDEVKQLEQQEQLIQFLQQNVGQFLNQGNQPEQ